MIIVKDLTAQAVSRPVSRRVRNVRCAPIAFAIALVACDASSARRQDDAGMPPTNAEAVRSVLANIVDRSVLPTYLEMQTAAAQLVERTRAFEASGSVSDRDAARAAWSNAMSVWQRAEVFAFGPAGLRTRTLGGRDLRDEIYAWPIISACRIDQEIVMQSYRDAATFAGVGVNARSLATIELLLFIETTTTACPSTSPIVANGSWAALGDAEVSARRRSYARAASEAVQQAVNTLVRAWESTGDNFAGEVRTAGAGSRTYATAQAGLNAVSDALFYLDLDVKDMKLAIPAGISMSCMQTSCPTRVEAPWSQLSREHVIENLRAAETVLLGAPRGTDAPGFDDLLRMRGASELADRLAAALSAAIDSVGAIRGTLATAVVEDRDSVVRAHAAVKLLTDLLKTELLSVLDLELPMRAEGDAD